MNDSTQSGPAEKRNFRRILPSLSRLQIPDPKKEMLFSELLSLLGAGLDFSASFRLLIEGEKDRRHKALLQRLYADVVAGSSLWRAMEMCGRFSPLDRGVVRIGEETGRLTESLEFLTDYYAKRTEQHRMVRSAVSYPLIVLGVAVVVVIFMLVVVVPMFEQVYARMGGELPTLTRWIIGASKQMPLFFGVAAAVLLGGAAGYLLLREQESFRRAQAALLMYTPLVGNIIRKNNQAHFCKLLYLLTASGVPLLTGIEMLREIITFYPYRQSFGQIADGLRRGRLLSASLEEYPMLYDRKLVILLRVGEETNRLPQMLRKQSDELTRELEYRLRQLGSMLEPLLILFVGLLVAIVLISMYLPMFKLGGAIN
ncbi:general secretion pathway protein GspF [Bacteroidia bacterium]|nr:general secretion pathway protein GspF [Bacteroidia bacterium]